MIQRWCSLFQTVVRLILRIFLLLLCFHRCDRFNPPNIFRGDGRLASLRGDRDRGAARRHVHNPGQEFLCPPPPRCCILTCVSLTKIVPSKFCFACCQGSGRQQVGQCFCTLCAPNLWFTWVLVSTALLRSHQTAICWNIWDAFRYFADFSFLPIAYLYLLATRGLLGLRIRAPKPQGLIALGSCLGQPSLL